MILSTDEVGKARLWNAKSGDLIQIIDGVQYTSKAILSSGGLYSAFIDTSRVAIKLFNNHSGEVVHIFRGHTKRINMILFSPDDLQILTCSYDGTAKLWSTKSGNLIQSFDDHTKPIASVVFSKGGNEILTGSFDGTAKLWNIKTGEVIYTIDENPSFIVSAIFSPNDELILVATDSLCKLYYKNTGKLIKSFENFGDYIDLPMCNNDLQIEFNPNNLQFLVKTSDNLGNRSTKLWDIVSGKIIHSFTGSDCAIDRSGELILENTTAYVNLYYSKNLDIFKSYKSKDGRYYTLAVLNPDKSQLLLSDNLDTVIVIDIKSGQELFAFNQHYTYDVSKGFSNDGLQILIQFDRKLIYEKTLNLQTGHLNYSVYHSSLSRDTPDQKLWVGRDKLGIGSAIWDVEKSIEILRFYFFDRDPNLWVHLHPSGLFDASPEAMELMYWTKGLEVIEFAQLKDRYWVPGLWEKVMKGEPLPDARNMQDLKLQPEVEMGEVQDGKIPVTLTKRDGGYGKVSILINGKEIEADARGTSFDKTKETQTIYIDLKDHPNLLNGENTIAVKASSEDGFVVGRAEEKKVTMSFQTPKPHFYAVVVGTGKFTNSSINLKYPEKDAQSMSTALKLGSEELFGKDNTHIYTLTTDGTDRPTKERIKAVFTEIGKTAKSTDVILVYLSGHGIAWGGDQGDFHYITTEASAANAEAYNDEVIRKNYTISSTEFTEYLKAIAANKQVMIIDACSSGKAVENLMASRDIDISSIKAIDRMKDRTGMFVISGSAADAVSYEASRYGQGLLTYSILQAMKGASLRDGAFFDVNMLLNYARETVPKLAAGIGGIQTPLLLIPKGGSFDIGQVNETTKGQIPLSSIKPVFVRTTFVDGEAFTDDLNLSKLIDDQLNQIAMRGKESNLVFLDTREFPEAYKLSGGYSQSNGTITLKLKIKGPKTSEHQLSAKTQEELVEKVLEIVEGLE